MDSNVLVIAAEDEEHLQRMLITRLRSEGYLVALATSAEEALFILDQESFGLVILDLLLPDTTQPDLVRRLKLSYSSIPILILTGVDYEEDALQEILEAGADGYVSKLDHQIENLIAETHRLIQVRLTPA